MDKDTNWRDSAIVLAFTPAGQEVPYSGDTDLYAHSAGKYPQIIFSEVEPGYFKRKEDIHGTKS